MNLKMLIRHLSPTCQEASRLQSEAMDHELGGTIRLGLKIHLLICRICRRYGRQLRLLRETMRDSSGHLLNTSPHQLSGQARERMKRSLRREA